MAGDEFARLFFNTSSSGGIGLSSGGGEEQQAPRKRTQAEVLRANSIYVDAAYQNVNYNALGSGAFNA